MPPPRARHVAPPQHPSDALTCFWLGTPAESGRLMLVGELDLATAERAREVIGDAQDQTSALICDVGDVWFVDLSGLRVLLDAAARARETGALLTITNCPPLVPRMLALLSLEHALDIQTTARLTTQPALRVRSASPRHLTSAGGFD